MQFLDILTPYARDENFIFLALASLVIAALAGAIVHRVMGASSFGSVGNTMLIVFAIVLAQWIDPPAPALAANHNAMRIAIISAVVATLLLATAGMVKSWLGRPR